MGVTRRGRRRTRGTFAITATIGLVAGTLAVVAPGAGAVANTCRARNITQGTASSSNLQGVIKAASGGDVITVKLVCVGNFKIGRKLTLVGKPTPDVPRPVLHANGVGRVLLVSARVKLTNLKITGGDVPYPNEGAGIYIEGGGTLRLTDTVVRGNRADANGAGVANYGTLIMDGSSSVMNNSGAIGAGIFNASANSALTMNDSSSVTANTRVGIYNYYGTVTMNDASSVSDNTENGIINQFGVITLNGESSVSGNTSGAVGGGIWTDYYSTLTMNDSSSVSGNTASAHGGGIYATRDSTLTMNDSSSVTGNTADADDANEGAGGGIYRDCTSTLTGAVDGGNVNDNYRGIASPVEDNIAIPACG